jgi:hypothetical protein
LVVWCVALQAPASTLKVASPDGPAVAASDTLLKNWVCPVGPASQ